MTSNRVNLIHKNDCRSSFAGLVEKVTNAGGTNADVQLHELRSGDGEERHLGFPRNRFGKQSLTRSWRPVQKYTARYLGSHRGEFHGVNQEFLDFLQLLHGLIFPSNVSERYLRVLFVKLLGLGR